MRPRPSARSAPVAKPPPAGGTGAGEAREAAESLESFLVRQARVRPRKLARRAGVRDLADVEDARQDAALAWLVKRPDIAAGAREGAWWTTLQHRLLGRRRKQLCEKAREPEVQAHLTSLCARVASAETQLDRDRAKAWCIAQVDPIRRDVAERNLLCDETLEMIARQQGKHIGTARSQLARAKEDLKAAVARLPERERRALRCMLAEAAGLVVG